MKVLAINGSPHKEGNTNLALKTVMQELEAEGIETELLHIGNKAVRGCISCGRCIKEKDCKCSINDDVNGWIQKMIAVDGLLLGSPVYYSGINGTMKAFLDRAFYVSTAAGRKMRHKVGAAVVAVRRAGAVPAVDQINKYFTISEMLMPASNYWNMVYGMTPGESAGDLEGLQTMKVLGRNMAWLMKVLEYSKGHVAAPALEQKTLTNFIR